MRKVHNASDSLVGAIEGSGPLRMQKFFKRRAESLQSIQYTSSGAVVR